MEVNPNLKTSGFIHNNGPQRAARKNVSDLPKDLFATGAVDQALENSDVLKKMVAKGGRLHDINGEKRIQLGNDWFRPYENREGYDENFLGARLEMPQLDPSVADQASKRIDDPNKSELEYTHFSIVQNKERKMPFFTAVNIDGAQVKEVERSGKWLFDPRIPREST